MEIPIVLPFLIGSLHNCFITTRSGIVNEDIGATKLAFYDIHQLLYVFCFRHIRGHSNCPHIIVCGNTQPRVALIARRCWAGGN